MLSFSTSLLVTILAISSAQQAAGHGVLTAVAGANGVTGVGMGVDPSTPRDGTTRNPFQQDTSVIRDKEIAAGTVDACGRTNLAGNNDIATQMAAAVAAGLPSMGADGSIKMTVHQVNGDGAGPYTCGISADGTGKTFVAATVTTNVPGKNSRSRAKATDFPLTAMAPAGMTCTGGPNGDACLVRCRNAANAGPFGGCAAVTNNVPLAAAPPAAVAPPATAPAATAPPAAGNTTATEAPAAASNTTATETPAAPAAVAGTANPPTEPAAIAPAAAPPAAGSSKKAGPAGPVAAAGEDDPEDTADDAAATKDATKAGAGGRLAKLFGNRDTLAPAQKRAIKSRIVSRRASYWI